MRKFLNLAADGMAGFLDLTVGALIAFAVKKVTGPTPPWEHLLWGAVLGFLPDVDAFKAMFTEVKGDHRLTVMHRPLVMLPICGVVAYIAGGAEWVVIAVVCLTWHYAHDSRWLGSVSDIDWGWPITNRDLPYMDHHVWRETYWLVPSRVAITEIAAGTAILGYLIAHYTGAALAGVASAAVLWVGAGTVWALHRR